MMEPGIDEHGWASRWESLEPDLHESPAEALIEADDLVSEMMEARGLPLEERDGGDITEPETIRQFAEAHRVAQLIRDGDSYDPGDIANAVDAYRTLYENLLATS